MKQDSTFIRIVLIFIISIGLAYLLHRYIPKTGGLEGFTSQVEQLPFDEVIYINLDERKDRDAELRAEMKRIGIPDEKIHRLSAVKRSWGILGCSLSHIACYKIIIERKWKRTLILEDDAGFEDGDQTRWSAGVKDIQAMVNSGGITNLDSKWDVIFLGGFVRDPEGPESTEYKTLFRTRNSTCAHAYIVRGEYVPKLLENSETAVQMLLKQPANLKQYFIDNSMNRLMEIDRWFISIPTLAYQRESYSDIEGKPANADAPLRGQVVRAWAKGTVLS
jgi:hypothetical protein